MSSFSIWKIIGILFLSAHTTQAVSLRCYENSINDYKEVSLEQSPALVNTSYIKLNQDLIIFVHGYSSDIDKLPFFQDIMTNLIDTFGDTKSYCALNWKDASTAYLGALTQPITDFLGIDSLGFNYFPVSIIAGKIGVKLGNTLVEMKSRGILMEEVYLMGLSEGAHLAGAAGRAVKSHGSIIGRITGLDPANPAIEKHLDKSCAILVDLIHTNPGLYGTNEAAGHIDFWVNKGCLVQPGCKQYTVISFIPSNLCSHLRSLSLMADAIKYPNSQQGRRATSYSAFERSHGTLGPRDVNTIGFNINPNNTGSFYLCTKAKSEYGLGAKGMDPASCKCPCT